MRLTNGFASHSVFCERACRTVCAFALALCLALSQVAVAAAPALADVRRSDIVAGTPMEQRGIQAIKCPSIDANYAYLMDENGKVYFERDAHTPVQIASITKTMTALVAVESAPLDTEIVISAKAAEIGESSAGLREGDVLDLETALKALMIPSGNDAAVAIAETIGHRMLEAEGSQGDDDAALSRFVEAMNAKASELGCEDTLFENPHGLDDGEYAGDLHSTAHDVALFVSAAMRNDTIRSIVGTGDDTIEVQRDGQKASIALESTDILIGEYDGACGVKTGFTDLAGSCFAGASNRNGTMLYAIVLDSSSDAQRFVDATTLFDWVYDNQVDYKLAQSSVTAQMSVGGQTTEVAVVAEVAHADWINKTVKATLADPDQTIEVFALDGNVSQSFTFDDVHGNVSVGDVLGKATFYQNNQVVAEVNVVACEQVAAPGIFETVGIWWDRFVRGFTGQSQQAESVVLNQTPLVLDKQATTVS